MKRFFALVLIMQAPLVHACTCAAVSPPIEKWVKQETDASAFVFMGTVQSVHPKKGGEAVQIAIAEQFKGKFDGNARAYSMCQNFRIVPGDKRVFFVSPDGAILGCSDYKNYLTDLDLIKKLKHVLGAGT